jgi:NAD(P) transhydrogenase
MKKYDVIIIGSGPGGQKAAIQSAKLNKKVAIIEKEQFPGGYCVYKGTIPSKTLREAALNLSRFKRNANIFNIELKDELEISSLFNRLETVIESHKDVISKQLQSNNIDIIHGRASLIDKHTVEILSIDGSNTHIHADYIIIATGSRPRTPTDIEVDHENILDSDSILSQIYIPRSLLVLGGGVIACEYATIFAILGTKVTLIDKAPLPLGFIDKEIIERFVKSFEAMGGNFIGNTSYEYLKWDYVSQVETKLSNGEVIKTDKALFALGRVANIEGLGLSELGIELEQGRYIKVNEHYQTNYSNIYAVGDVVGFPGLASSSMVQGRIAVRHIYEQTENQFDKLPYGIYAIPEIASVGFTEEEAEDVCKKVYVGRANFEEVARSQIDGNTDGMLKLIANEEGYLIGVQIIGENATDLVHTGEMAILNKNKVSVFLDNILNFPTLNEAYRIAALNLNNQLEADSIFL